MKPNFALNLTFEGIGLLHRVPSGWHLVGEVALEAPDLRGALNVLRQTALALDPAGLRTKLVIPNEQIRFLTLAADPHATESDVRAALDGATPYAVDDLSYDWTFEGGMLHIAAVARETLAEAEAFAAEHGFNPVSFVATPDQGVFPGEPFFGLTSVAAAVVGAGVPVARDLQPIRVIGHVRMPVLGPAPAQDEAPLQDIEAPAPSDQTQIGTGLPKTDPVAPEADADPTPAPAARVTDEDKTGPTPASTPSVPLPEAPVPTFSSKRAHNDAVLAASPTRADTRRDGAADDGPARLDLTAAGTVAATLRPRVPTPMKAPPLSALTASQKSALTKPQARAEAMARLQATAAPEPHPDAAGLSADTEDKAPALTAVTPPTSATPRMTLAPATRMPPPGPAPKPAPAAIRPARGKMLADAAGAVFATLGRALRRLPRTGGNAPLLPAARKTAAEQRRMTIFGARKPAADGIGTIERGKPRFLGLALTLALLIFLAGVAAWASLISDTTLGWLRQDDTPAMAEAADEITIDTNLIAPEELADTEPDSEMEASDTVGAPDGPAAPLVVATLETSDPDLAPESGASAVPGLSQPAPPTAAENLARYAATGIWEIPPEAPAAAAPIDLDQLYIASIDPAVVPGDAVALPGANSLRPDTLPGPLTSPVAAGTLFRLDARGLVEATPEGALTPDGVRVYAGRPPLIPPAAALTRAAPAVAAPAVADTRLAAFRPRLRPDNLTDGAERAALGGLTRNELSAFRPRPRPASVVARAEAMAAQDTAAKDAATVSAAIAAAAASTAAVATAPPTVKPKLRPGDLRAPSATTAPTSENDAGTAAPATGATTIGGISREEAEDDEGEVEVASARGRTVAPKVPSQANVAKAATEKNVLNLRQVNLIGVYGNQQSRRALVRLSNGRYQKVKVGDRVDGGRVVAISDGELRYTKGGRNVTLRMPRS